VTDAPGARGHMFGANQQIAMILIQMGDLAQAEAYLRRSEALIQQARASGLPGWRAGYPVRGQSWEASVEATRAMIFEARGQFREAEAAYVLAERRRRASIKGILSSKNPPPLSQLLQNADHWVLGQARMKARQGRLAEAEAEARRALLSRLKDQGKYHPQTPKYIMGLANILIEQGRYEEAERLMRIAIEINQKVGVLEDSHPTATLIASLGGILNLERKFQEAVEVYAELDKRMANWEPRERQALELSGSRIYSLYASGQVEAGIAAAQALLQREIARVGEGHFDTAAARGTLANGYMRAGRDADAVREFKTAIPILMAGSSRENPDEEDTTLVAARRQRLQNIVEAYLRRLSRLAAGRAATSRPRPFLWRTLFAANPCSTPWRHRARAWRPRTRPLPSSSAVSRTSACRSTPCLARSTTRSRWLPPSATRRASRRLRRRLLRCVTITSAHATRSRAASRAMPI